MINVCIPTLNNYGGLLDELNSLENGDLKPDQYWIIDNGLRLQLDFPKTKIFRPSKNIGVAKSWNYFINNCKGINLFCNDDLIFYPESLRVLMDNLSETRISCPSNMGQNLFSCFILPEFVVKSIGEFDESLSPNYGYFEDNDYYRRLCLMDMQDINLINCRVDHVGSKTFKNFSKIELTEHHKKFEIAKKNYIKKWGGVPGKETYLTPYDR